MPAITPDLMQRARGSLLGAAIGDAFGMALQGTLRRPVNAQVRGLRAGRLEAGRFTANTEAMLAVAESLLAPSVPASSTPLGKGNLPHPDGRAGGLLARLAGRPQAAVRETKPGAPTAEALLCSLPLALIHIDDRAACLEEARRRSCLTHPHPECVAGSAFVAAMLWHLLRGAAPGRAIQESLRVCNDLPEALVDTIQQAPGRVRDRLTNRALVGPTLECVIWGLVLTASYVEAVTRVANLGGDAAIATALVGALAGAAYRYSGIPADWRMQVHGFWPPQSERVWREPELVALAERLILAAGR